MHTIRLLAIPLLLLSCQRAGAEEKTPMPLPKPSEQTALDERTALLRPIQVDSLTVLPIVATEAGLAQAGDLDVLVLDEAMGGKLVAIKEKEDESVNALTLTNNADKPLFLLAGEVIIGGKQDRIIGQNTIISAKTTQAVPVFCVEHGRWDNSSKVFASGKALAHGRLRGRAQFEDQSQVWQEVATKNELRKTKNATDTYRQVAQQQASGLGDSEKKLRTALAKLAPADRSRLVGYAVALDGKVATVDVFGSPKLFRKLEDKLLRSYLTEAIDVKATAANKPPTVADVKAFIADAEKAPAEKSYESDEAETVRNKGNYASKASVELKPGKMGKADKKPSVYKQYQAK